MDILSWNVNGMKSAVDKGFVKKMLRLRPDIICVQEIKTECRLNMPGYNQYWNVAQRRGYSGTAVFTRIRPLSVNYYLGVQKLDTEGRIICMEFKDFFLVNVYVPNTNNPLNPRREYRSAWDSGLRDFVKGLSKPAVLCGDFNVAREFIDTYPENLRNKENPLGFTTDERDGMEKLISLGFVDAYRKFFPERRDCYTWWSQRQEDHRIKNKGWRLDYFLVSDELMDQVKSVRHYPEIMGSDHCPITLSLTLIKQEARPSDELAAEWKSIDWDRANEKVLDLQQKITKAAYARNWRDVSKLQKTLTRSMEAKELAVAHVTKSSSVAGVDGEKWGTDAEKMNAVYRLTHVGYKAQPYRCMMMNLNGRERPVNVSTYYDRAIQALYAYSLDPVAEATADRKSFAFRKGRSAFDAHAYIVRLFDGPDAPKWVVHVDIHAYYDHLNQLWLMHNIPMNGKILYEILSAGVLYGGKLFPTEEGISLGTSISPILGNMALDGLQRYIYARLLGYENDEEMPVYSSEYSGAFPKGFDFDNGNLIRYADDILVAARSLEDARRIKGFITEFITLRGLSLNEEKTYITTTKMGFEFLSRKYYYTDTRLMSEPSDAAVADFEFRLRNTILNHKGSQKSLILTVNRMLHGWANYHKVSVLAHQKFRHIDSVVQSCLLKKVRELHPDRQLGHIQRKYWYKLKNGDSAFMLAENPGIRVIKLSDMMIVKHKGIKTAFNPYLDMEYYSDFNKRREIQKHSNPTYQGIWNRQDGKCFYCGNPMYSDQNVCLIEKRFGEGWWADNLAYVHQACSKMELMNVHIENPDGYVPETINIRDLLSGILSSESELPGPYENLREFFRLKDKPTVSLTFKKIEKIMGAKLDVQAYTNVSFWTDGYPGFLEKVPDSECISLTWRTQNYVLHTVDLENQQVTFKQVKKNLSGLNIPKALTGKKLPISAVREAEGFFKYLINKYRL